MADFFRLKTFECDINKVLKSRGLEEGGKVQQFIDTECLRLSAEFAPFDQHILIESGNIHTKIGSGHLEYRTPYARRWYYMPANFSKDHNPKAGNYWFERMKQQYIEKIRAGAKKIASGNAN